MRRYIFPQNRILFSAAASTSTSQVVYGTALLTPAIQATGGALIAGKVPSDW